MAAIPFQVLKTFLNLRVSDLIVRILKIRNYLLLSLKDTLKSFMITPIKGCATIGSTLQYTLGNIIYGYKCLSR